MSKGSLLICLYCLVLCSDGTNPGFMGRITNKGLDYARQEGIKVLQQQLAKLMLPDFSGSFRVSVLGKVDYKFHSLTIQSFQLPSSSIAPSPGVGLEVSITNTFAELTGKWQVKKRWFKDSGSFDLRAEGLSISVSLTLGSDPTGKLSATTSDCGAHISDVHVHISGKLGWLYNLFHNSIESAFRRSMEDKICEEVTSSASSKLQPFLHSLPVTAKIDNVSGIDYSLVGPPVATNSYVDLKLKGKFFPISHRSPAPFPPPPLDFPVDHDRMLYFGISTYFFNTAGDVYYRAGALTFVITDGMIPKEFQIRLKTTDFEPFIPQLKKWYPNMPMELQVLPSSAPSLMITPEILSLTPLVDVQAFAILPNSTLAPLFVIGVATTISANITVNSTMIFGSLKLGRLKMSLKHSDVGSFSVQLMEALMNYFAASSLVPQMNARLAKGFPLPLPEDVHLSNVVFQPHQGFLLFGADVHYGP